MISQFLLVYALLVFLANLWRKPFSVALFSCFQSSTGVLVCQFSSYENKVFQN